MDSAVDVAGDPGTERIRVGTSACLMGQSVRYDGSHKRDRFLTDTLGELVEWVAVCPEVGAGMGVPRPTLRLVGDAARPRLVTNADGTDWTEAALRFARDKLDELAGLDLCGFVLKSRSPSCGMERVRVYDHSGMPRATGVGVFARALMERFPLLPVEEEGRLHDLVLRDAFLDAVFAYGRWRAFERGCERASDLIEFHRANKLLLRAHSPEHAARLGRVVAEAGAGELGEIKERYGTLYMRAMKERATRGRHVETMRYVAGRLRGYISESARATLHESIDDYRAGYAPRSVPVALLRHHAREHQIPYLGEQSYLEPYPKRLGRP